MHVYCSNGFNVHAGYELATVGVFSDGPLRLHFFNPTAENGAGQRARIKAAPVFVYGLLFSFLIFDRG